MELYRHRRNVPSCRGAHLLKRKTSGVLPLHVASSETLPREHELKRKQISKWNRNHDTPVLKQISPKAIKRKHQDSEQYQCSKTNVPCFPATCTQNQNIHPLPTLEFLTFPPLSCSIPLFSYFRNSQRVEKLLDETSSLTK